MKTTGERLSYLISTQKVNMSQFCEIHGLSYQSINPICNNHREIGINIIRDLMKIFPNLNLNWLLYGTGNINYTKISTNDSDMMLQEPGDNYNEDVVEKLFLTYLDKKSIRKKVLEIVNDGKK